MSSPQSFRLSCDEKRAEKEKGEHSPTGAARVVAGQKEEACKESKGNNLDLERIGWLGAFGMIIYGPTNHCWFNFQERSVTAFKSRSDSGINVQTPFHKWWQIIDIVGCACDTDLPHRRRCEWGCTPPCTHHFQLQHLWHGLPCARFVALSSLCCVPIHLLFAPNLRFSVPLHGLISPCPDKSSRV